MYKIVFIDYMNGWYEIQNGKTQELENIINEWNDNGYEFVSMSSAPYPSDAANSSFILVFKTKS